MIAGARRNALCWSKNRLKHTRLQWEQQCKMNIGRWAPCSPFHPPDLKTATAKNTGSLNLNDIMFPQGWCRYGRLYKLFISCCAHMVPDTVSLRDRSIKPNDFAWKNAISDGCKWTDGLYVNYGSPVLGWGIWSYMISYIIYEHLREEWL